MDDRTYTIVFTDDDADDRELFSYALIALGVNVELKLFDESRKVLDYLNTLIKLPDMVMLDINMPCMTGLEALQHIRKDSKFNAMPVSIYTTSANDNDIETARTTGADYFIKKPTSIDGLKKLINHILRLCEDTSEGGRTGRMEMIGF